VDWQVQVDNKRVHMMEFNKSISNPMIINGWSDLRTIYHFEGYKKILGKVLCISFGFFFFILG
jgi:hypothetical protein